MSPAGSATTQNATEIVLEPRQRRARLAAVDNTPRSAGGGSASKAAAGALRIGRAVSAALSEQRVLGKTDTRLVGFAGMILLAIAVLGLLLPLVVIVPLALVLVWMGFALLVRATSLHKERRSQGLPSTRVRPATSVDPARKRMSS
jgi:cardiolipin synthase A/B